MGVAIAGYQGALLITSPPSINLAANFALQDSGDHTTFQVSAANAAFRYWDRLAAFTFQTAPDGTTWTTVTPASIQHIGGKVTFASAVTGATPSARVTAGKYFSYALLANITLWQFDGEMMMEDNTAMSGAIGGGGGSAFKTFQPTLLTGLMTVSKWWVPETSEGYIADIVNGTYLLFSGVAGTGNRYEGYGYIKKFSTKIDVAKLIDSPLDIQFDGKFYAV